MGVVVVVVVVPPGVVAVVAPGATGVPGGHGDMGWEDLTQRRGEAESAEGIWSWGARNVCGASGYR